MVKIARIVLSEGLRSFDKPYDYIIPERLQGAVSGMRVLVPFGAKNKLYSGWMIDIRQDEPVKGLKEIESLVDEHPLLNAEMLKLAEWMKNRYLCTWGDAIRCMIPAGVNLRRHKAVRAVAEPGYLNDSEEIRIFTRIREAGASGVALNDLKKGETFDVGALVSGWEKSGLVETYEFFEQRVNEKTRRMAYPVMDRSEFDELHQGGKIRSIQQARAMEFLYDEGMCTIEDLLLIPGVTQSTVRSMHKKCWIGFVDAETERNPFEDEDPGVRDVPPEPTECQKKALADITPMLEEKKLNEALLHGVTGSGKTEIYLRLIEETLNKRKTAIVMVPEISLTPQMTSRFTRRFGNRVAIQHSRLSAGERYDQWRKIQRGEVDIVIGARSAVFAPLTNLGIIIVDEEHETTYKSENAPKYDARHIARARCNMNGALLLLGSATPSVETYFRAVNKKIGLYELNKRANAGLLPEVITVDMRSELEQGVRSVLSRRLEEELVEVKKRNEQAIIFINRRGYSLFMLCRDCGFVLRCPNCSVSMTCHSREKRAICHYCGYTTLVPPICPKCGKDSFKGMGAGTQRIEEELSSHPAGFRVLRMDLDTTGTKYGHKKILDAFRNGEADILIGTQMVAKGHDFPRVTLVGILAADAMLYSGDFKAPERTFQLITQASGRAGRGSLPGKVVLQTYNIDEYAITTAIAQDYKAFYKAEIMMRNQLFLPPFSHIGLIMAAGCRMYEVKAAVDGIYRQLAAEYGSESGISISQPLKAPVYIVRNRMRWRIIIRHSSVPRLLEIMGKALDIAGAMRLKETQVSVDIDPAGML